MPKRSPANVDKSPEKSRRPLKGVAVDASLRGRGPAKGAPNAGRPPNAWREKMEALRDRWLIAAEVERIVDDPDHPSWFQVGKFVHEATAGRPHQAVDVTSAGEKIAPQTIIIGGQTVQF